MKEWKHLPILIFSSQRPQEAFDHRFASLEIDEADSLIRKMSIIRRLTCETGDGDSKRTELMMMRVKESFIIHIDRRLTHWKMNCWCLKLLLEKWQSWNRLQRDQEGEAKSRSY